MFRISIAILAGALFSLATAAAEAAPLNAGPPIEASATNPLAGCPPDGAGVNFPNAEVEPFSASTRRDDANLIGVYQQDRYSNGGAKGTTAAVSPRRRRPGPTSRSRPTRAAPAAAISAPPTRGCPLAPTASRTP